MFNYPNSDSQHDDQAIAEADEVQLAIKLNDESYEYECALCGDERTSANGPELFLAESWDLVCDECGRKYAPQLMALLDLGGAAEGYVAIREALPPSDES